MTFVQEAPKTLSRLALATYRALPISAAHRQQLKHLLFVVFGFAFARMDAYKRWKAYRDIQTEWPSTEPAAPDTAAAASPATTSSRQAADGRWEWGDYGAVKSRIAHVKGRQLTQVAPAALDLIDIGNEALESAAARVRLPEPPVAPDVSIILPAFNNLKLTLECLLSIATHADSRVSFEIILADDASTDGTPHIAGRIPNLKIMRNDRNLGFLRNCNKALAIVTGRYVVYLNNDVQVTRNWLANLYETFETHHNVGAAGPRFVYPSGHLQEAGVAFRHDGTADMVGLNDDPEKPRYRYARRVDYISGACLMLPAGLARQMGGFSEEFLPCYCEDSDLCLRVQAAGYHVYCNPASTIIHHLSKTTAAFDSDFKLRSISANLVTLQQKWQEHFDRVATPRIIAFYLPPPPPALEHDGGRENGLADWNAVTEAVPNFVGHYQPRLPADSECHSLPLSEVMQRQADLARRYGIHGFCFYCRSGGERLLSRPIESMLATGQPDLPFCLCWVDSELTGEWDSQGREVLRPPRPSPEDDGAVDNFIRCFRDARYIRIDGRPMILVDGVTRFADFSATVARWRRECRRQGIGEIYVAMVEPADLMHTNRHPGEFGCDAAVEAPPQGLAEQTAPSGDVINQAFTGVVADYRNLAVRVATRELPGYTRFKAVIPGWDDTARRQNDSLCFEHATPGAFQAWLEEAIDQTRQQYCADERLVFIRAWNEWTHGAYLEPDRRFGHTYLEAVKNAADTPVLLRRDTYWHGN